MAFDSIQLVAFDCDGVMFDSHAANTAFYNHVLAHFGRPPMTQEQFDFAHMHTARDAIAHLFPDPVEFEAAFAHIGRVDYRQFFPLMEMEPNLLPLLERIRPAVKTAVATNRTTTLRPLVDEFRLAPYFDLVVGAGDVAHPKPHPDMLLKILDHFRLKPDQMAYVGDSRVDADAARAAGVPLIAYRDSRLDAAAHISGLDEIANLINGRAPSTGPS